MNFYLNKFLYYVHVICLMVFLLKNYINTKKQSESLTILTFLQDYVMYICTYTQTFTQQMLTCDFYLSQMQSQNLTTTS